ncbi:MAG TPA: N-formylglutamate amidohydrolase [Sandaracinaceae bacterium LLY-WYZ-13_1]|nr:N-formylglutamate amidohydrolase [Sandaracinaceae bacterium LLY-WYZ-13_1]
MLTLTRPEVRETAVLVEVPHAGLGVPEAVRDQVAVTRDVVLRDSDVYVDKLYEDAPSAGATLLVARVSRYVVDLNRAPDDVDPHTVPDHPDPRGVQPRGVVWRVTTEGLPALREPLRYDALVQRLSLFHEPYHRTVVEQLEDKRARFGHSVLLAAHSMPSVSRSGLSTGPRADVVPGTRGRTSADARVIECVDAHFRDAGLSVRHDDPYRGGWSTSHYGRPDEHWHAVQIELNRALYVDEATSQPKDGDFEALQALLVDLVRKLGEISF